MVDSTKPKIDIDVLDYAPNSKVRSTDLVDVRREFDTVRRGLSAVVESLGGIEAIRDGTFGGVATEPRPPDTTGPTSIDAPNTLNRNVTYVNDGGGNYEPFILLDWDASTTLGVTQYTVEWQKTAENIWRTLNTIGAASTLIQGQGPLIVGTEYKWRVRAETTARQSAWTESTAFTPAAYSTTPTAPSSLSYVLDEEYMVISFTATKPQNFLRFNIYDSAVKFAEATTSPARIKMTKRTYSITIDMEDIYGNKSAASSPALSVANSAPTFTGVTVGWTTESNLLIASVSSSAANASARQFTIHVGTSAGFSASSATYKGTYFQTNDITETDIQINADVSTLLVSDVKRRVYFKLQAKDALSDALGEAAVYSSESNNIIWRSETEQPVQSGAPTAEITAGDKYIESGDGRVLAYTGAAWSQATPAIERSTGYLSADITGTRTLQGAGVLYTPTAGNLSVGTAASPSSETKYLYIPFTFFLYEGVVQYTVTGGGYVSPDDTAETTFICPIIMPRGLTITEVAVSLYKQAAGDAASFTFYRSNDGGSTTSLGTGTLSANATWTLVTSTFTEAVGTADRQYIFVVTLNADTTNTDVRIGHGKVTYTMDSYKKTY